jgi:tetratricopeptide (TPR) repeat protein
MPRTCVVLTLVVLLLLPGWAQRRPGAVDQSSPKELSIRVTYESGEAVEFGIRVQLQNGTGTPVNDAYTDDRGTVRFVVDAGQYRVRITGAAIEETNSDKSFYIDPRESMHSEYVSVRRKPGAESSTQGHVSAAMLQIPDKARSEYEKGVKELTKKEYGKAREHLEKATTIYPKYAEAFNGLGVVAMNTGDILQGRILFDRAMEADPEYPGAYVNRAKIALHEKDLAKGEKLLNKAVMLDPLNPEAISLLSVFQLQLGQVEAAIASAERVHALPHEKFAMVHAIAGNAYEQQRQIPDAIREYKLFLQEAPTSSTAPKVKVAIQTLEAKKP